VTESLSIRFDDQQVSALALAPADATCAYVLAHGAGAGMAHPFMTSVAEELAARGVATLRYQFPYMERGSKRTDAPVLAHAAVRAAVACAGERWPGLPRFAGGKSFGGRMTSQAAAALVGVHGLAFFGFPLHPPEKPGIERAAHLDAVQVPMLFLQGTRDEFAELALLRGVCARLPMAKLVLWADADHSFHVPAKSPTKKKDPEVRRELCDALAAWAHEVISR